MSAISKPITVSVTVLMQMFLYLRSLQVDIDAWMNCRTLGEALEKSGRYQITYLLGFSEPSAFRKAFKLSLIHI